MNYFVFSGNAAMVADVQSWIDGSAPINNGWIVRNSAEGAAFSAVRLYSSQHATTGRRPDIEIDYDRNSGYSGEFCPDVDECAGGAVAACGAGATAYRRFYRAIRHSEILPRE